MPTLRLAQLEDLLKVGCDEIVADGRRLIDGGSVAKMARMIEGRLEQGEPLAQATIATVDFYSAKKGIDAGTPGVKALIAAVERWATTTTEELSPAEWERRRKVITDFVRRSFDAQYGQDYDSGEHGDWLDVDTNDFDVDPAASYLQRIADHFSVPLPSYGTNRQVIEFVLQRWNPASG